MDLTRFASLDIVLVCGLPGSGKARFCSAYFAESGRRRVSRRDIRRMLFEMTSYGAPWSEERFAAIDEVLVKHAERKIIEHLLQNGLTVAAENTCVTVASRRTYLAIAHQAHGTAGVIWLDTPVATCLERNRRRAPR
jgi:predicted kinase